MKRIGFKNPIHESLTPATSEALGRLLIDYQELEQVAHLAVPMAFIPIDPVAAFPLLTTKNLTTIRKLEFSSKLLNLAARRYNVKEVKSKNGLALDMVSRVLQLEHVELIFANFRFAVDYATQLLEYRNSLFHGTATVRDSEVVFVGRNAELASGAKQFDEKRDEVIHASLALYSSAFSVKSALEYLIATPPKSKNPTE